ncbi:PEP-CTERM sorting domain-containing protein, partial [Arthrospira platensis SPKY1]|nr:PEP-CTERM sorting domain-containing protein [Arthrospira platensis SPKY1]
TFSFSEFDSDPVFSEVLIRNPLGPDLSIEADGNLGILTIHGADLVAGTIYEGYIEIFYGDEVSGSFDPTVDFKRSITSFEIEAVPEPATYALVFGLLVAVITLLRRRHFVNR